MAYLHEDPHASEACLQMNYWSEELSEAQRSFYKRTEKEYEDVMAKVNDFITKEKGSIIERGANVLVLHAQAGAAPVPLLSNLVTSQGLNGNQGNCLFSLQTPSTQAHSGLQAVSSQPLVIQGGSVATGPRTTRPSQGQQAVTCQTPQGPIHLVMDPRVLIALPSQQVSGNQVIQAASMSQTTVAQMSAPVTVQAAPVTVQAAPVKPVVPPVRQPVLPKIRPIPSSRSSAKVSTVTTPSSQAKGTLPSTTASAPASTSTTLTSQKVSKSKPSTLTNVVHPSTSTENRPTENSSIGGLCAGNTKKKNTLDEVHNNASGPDSREVTINKLSGKTFPSLVVLARPHLKIREMTHPKLNQERSQLDSKVKCVLMYLAPKFTEWLIQQGLVRGEQFCNIHTDKDIPVKLKLGLYSDVSKFPFSGGYVWVSDCCPQRYVSVFSGSIFEGAPHPPTVLLKLMYHWCCQTNVQNVIQWVKIDNFYCKNFFTYMRSVCLAAVHEKHEKLGGPLKKVEVGVISLGTTSQDGNQRQVKVEVLGVMDVESKAVRLRAVEPLQEGERNYKRRFVKILEPLKQWVHSESIIQTDYTVDKGTLWNMGFDQVLQFTIPDPPNNTTKVGNQNIMEYLRRIVPRMFQNTLSLLSRQIIQQFLDELVWRERFGPTPAQAFDSLMSHLASQTKLDTGESLIVKLGKIAANPFRNWQYQSWKCDGMLDTVCVDPPSATRPPPLPPTPPVSVSPPATDTSSVKIKANKKPVKPSPEVESYPSIAITKPYKYKLDEQTENRMIQAVKGIENGLTLRKAVATFKVPRTVLIERTKDILRARVAAAQVVLSDDEEEEIRDHLINLYDWGYQFNRNDVRIVVKQYLDLLGRSEPRFKENYPTEMWIERFFSRHPTIRHRLSCTSLSRGNVIDPDYIKNYLFCLAQVIKNVPPENILNFMEIGLTGDPLKSMALELREVRHAVGKRKVKSASSVMLACSASGKILPSYVVFEGRPTFISKGHFPGEYYATKSGWFDETAFEYWVESVLIPWADELSGRKVVIGDSLAQLFTAKAMTLCLDKEISFLCMPCNVTGVLSPLDVALCDKLRIQWRTLTRAWASSHSDKFISPEEFPVHIYELLTSTISPGMQALIRKAFHVVGIYPYSSKNAMTALANGGVSLENESKDDQKPGDPKKRKRIYIGADEPSEKKKHTTESSAVEEVVLDDDSEVDVVAMEQALKSRSGLVSLDSYYYGTKLPGKEFLDTEHKLGDLNAKCPLCYTCVSDNISLMRHLLGHSDNPSADELSSKIICKYCATIFSTSEEYSKHAEEVHTRLESSENTCLICAQKLASRAKLVLHMQKTHTRLELPYICTICYYRSSEQYKLVDHFYEAHAKGEKIQCPYCLKCVAISNMGKRMQANIFFFMHHVKKHQANNSSRKCDKCALWFVHKGILNQHVMKDHLTCVGEDDIVPYVGTEVMMPEPVMAKPPELELAAVKAQSHPARSSVSSGCCVECRGTFSGENHFQDFMSCLLCLYSTHCGAAMKKHMALFHKDGKPFNPSEMNAPMPLQEDMYCVCGFRASDGNILANHLVKCMKRRVFTSLASAKKATGQAHQSVSLKNQDNSSVDGDASSAQAYRKILEGLQGLNNLASKKTGRPTRIQNSVGQSHKGLPEESSEKLTEFELSRDRPLSRASNSSNSSAKRKRGATEAGLEVLVADIPVKRKEDGGNVLSNHTDELQNQPLPKPEDSELKSNVEHL